MDVKTPLGRLPWWAVVVGNVAFWPTWTFAAGWAAHRTAAEHFRSDDLVTRLRAMEEGGTWYRDRLQIDRWKDRLPEAGAGFAGGYAKRTIGSSDARELDRFVVETRRAEHAHWGMAAGVAVTTLWNPWWAAPINLAVAAGSNLPCIAVQRYNRARLTRLLRRLQVRAESGG